MTLQSHRCFLSVREKKDVLGPTFPTSRYFLDLEDGILSIPSA